MRAADQNMLLTITPCQKKHKMFTKNFSFLFVLLWPFDLYGFNTFNCLFGGHRPEFNWFCFSNNFTTAQKVLLLAKPRVRFRDFITITCLNLATLHKTESIFDNEISVFKQLHEKRHFYDSNY